MLVSVMCVRLLSWGLRMRGIGGSAPSTDKVICEHFPGDRMLSRLLLHSPSSVTLAISLAGGFLTDFRHPLPGAELLVFQDTQSGERCRGVGGKVVGDKEWGKELGNLSSGCVVGVEIMTTMQPRLPAQDLHTEATGHESQRETS